MKFSYLILLSILISNLPMVGYSVAVSDTTGFRMTEPIDSLIVAVHNKRKINSKDSFINNFIKLDEAYLEAEKGKTKDEIYSARINLLPSPIKLPYNQHVRKFIDQYTSSNSGMGSLLGRAMYFMPLIESELNRNSLPHELKIIPLIESRLTPNAMSRTGAGGLWQMTYGTGKHYGLSTSSFVDERFDPILSTRAICKYLNILYGIYNDWTLVLAAYSCGSGTINKLLKRYPEAKNYWDLYPHLLTQSKNFIPAFIAMTYAYNFSIENGVTIKKPTYPVIVDTIVVKNRMLHLKQIATTIDIPIEILRALNPMYKVDVIPALNESRHIFIPADKIGDYIAHEEEIYAKADEYLKEYQAKEGVTVSTEGNYTTYSVKKGDILGLIAKKYKVKSSDILKWNNIKDARKIMIGQKLKIYI